MSELHLYNLIVDEDFTKMFPILPIEEYTDLEHEIVYKGCQNPIIIWHKIILNGVNQYQICHRWEVPFYIKEISIDSRNEAIIYICKNTLEHKNLTDEQKRYCIGRLYDAYKVQMNKLYSRQNQYTPTNPQRPEYISKSTTAQMLGNELGLSATTVSKYGIFAKSIDNISTKVPDIAKEMLAGIFHISHENTIKLAEMSANEIRIVYNQATKNGDIRLLHSAIKKKQKHNRERSKQTEKNISVKKPEIKQMPKYDPDAEISSLVLTIPMWISSMKRTQTISDFNQVSIKALWQLEQQLNSLQDSINILQTEIKERYHE
ncbi:hypothetical protein [Anaerosporobacter sp.]|uniref:hypothetical protein n=1 Tax=Anaerosporobacter sp. TaxID=1872529 RepID=UPI00286EB569|nr:hypothetical protein [Anaerosporobacter sp.]